MAMDDLDPFSEDNGPEDGEEGENGWKGGFAVDDEEWDMVDLQPIRQVSYSRPALVSVRDDDDFVATVDEFLYFVLSAFLLS